MSYTSFRCLSANWRGNPGKRGQAFLCAAADTQEYLPHRVGWILALQLLRGLQSERLGPRRNLTGA